MPRKSFDRAALGLLVLLAASDAHAIPRCSIRYRQDCNLCHKNPSGGGQRSAYAAQYLVPAELVMSPRGAKELEKIDPQIGANLSVGADLRTQHMTDLAGEGLQDFFLMQADLYFTFSVDGRNLLYLERGLREGYDLYGLSYTLPMDGYVKVGRFAPTYGWRFADHNHFVRSELGFSPPAHTDVGVELGIAPGETTLSLALMNGAPGSTLDGDGDPAFVGRAARRMELGTIGLSAGASVMHTDAGGARRTVAGPFGAVHWGRLTWMGELDAARSEVGGGTLTGVVATQELALALRPGLDLVGVYDFHDADIDLKSGKDTGFSVGLEAFPQPFVKFLALVRGWQGPSDNTQAILQAHFLY